jgi:hypothetical protein
MDTIFKIELVVEEVEREESFPVQEQDQGRVTYRDEKPASIIFAEHLAVAGSGIAAPVFVP